MSMLHEEPVLTAPNEVSGRSSPSTPPVRRRPWLTAALVIAALLIAGGMWWLLDSTVRVSEYNDVVAELDATEEALARAQEALLAEQSSAPALIDELARLTESEAALRARFEQADPAALLLGYFAGADRELVTGNSWDQSWAGVVSRDTAVEAINDPALTELYWQYIGGDLGQPVQEVAANEFVLRLVELTIEPILEGR